MIAKKRISPFTLETVLTAHLRHTNASFSQKTSTTYATPHKLLKEFLGGEMIFANITTQDIEEFFVHLKTEKIPDFPTRADGVKTRSRKPQTLNNYRSALSATWNWAIGRGYCEENVVVKMAKAKAPRIPIKPLTDIECANLIRAISNNGNRPGRHASGRPKSYWRGMAERDKAIISVLLECGLRASELCHLRIENVEFIKSGGNIHVIEGKGNKSRIVPFGRSCSSVLSNWLMHRSEAEPKDYLFSLQRHDNTPLTADGLYRMVKRLGKKIGLNISPHDLRTTAACMMVKNGMTAFHLQRVMGHSSILTTQRYVAAAEVDLNEAMKRASPLDNIRL